MLYVIRDKVTGDAVIGRLFLDGAFICNTLERRDKMLPLGTYRIEVNQSPKFKRKLPLIYGYKVAESRGIRIHAGNSSKDAAGCILVGMGRDTVAGTLTESKLAETTVTMLCRTIRHLTVTELG